ncbi:MAG TPA: hypothetical protein VN761_13630, partial [Candidatus Polarisedimenticolia bacterium]|nr:hypothetical protein [Candidatus Polarisedimenticolia bacterium]
MKRNSRFTRSIGFVRLRILFLIGLVAAVLAFIKEQFGTKPSASQKTDIVAVEVSQPVLPIK